jgi:hypothetical protein
MVTLPLLLLPAAAAAAASLRMVIKNLFVYAQMSLAYCCECDVIWSNCRDLHLYRPWLPRHVNARFHAKCGHPIAILTRLLCRCATTLVKKENRPLYVTSVILATVRLLTRLPRLKLFISSNSPFNPSCLRGAVSTACAAAHSYSFLLPVVKPLTLNSPPQT